MHSLLKKYVKGRVESGDLIINIRNDIRKAHGLENNTVILYAGNLSINKEIDGLERALQELSSQYNDLALLIIGGEWFSQDEVTDFVAHLRALSTKLPIPVLTTGFVALSDIQNWFAAADVFVCTSIWSESLERFHDEAMAAGLPIITTDRGGDAEVPQLGENDFVVENPELDSFVEKTPEVLSNKASMEEKMEKRRNKRWKKIQKIWKKIQKEMEKSSDRERSDTKSTSEYIKQLNKVHRLLMKGK